MRSWLYSFFFWLAGLLAPKVKTESFTIIQLGDKNIIPDQAPTTIRAVIIQFKDPTPFRAVVANLDAPCSDEVYYLGAYNLMPYQDLIFKDAFKEDQDE